MRDEKVNIQPGDEIVIVVPEGTDEDEMAEPNEWRFDDDPYDVVYYEFVNDED